MEMDVDAAATKLSHEERERLVSNFAVWLDRALENEHAPEGLMPEVLAVLRDGEPLPPLHGMDAAGQGSDLYSLWSSIVTLTQEVRVQGRLFKQLNETVAQSVKNGSESADAQMSRSETGAGGRPRKQEIDLLLDLRDRIDRGIGTARNASAELDPARLPRLARWLGVGRGYAQHAQEVFHALSHGYLLTLERLDEALVACGLDRIVCLNRIFDPQCMTVIDIEETGAIPEGTVVEVYRDGYEWNGKVYRSAQVRVARNLETKTQ
ncbi:MAG: nucleotide exchange factor GrpE [Acidobacteriaceae bacterium]